MVKSNGCVRQLEGRDVSDVKIQRSADADVYADVIHTHFADADADIIFCKTADADADEDIKL